jgi:type IV pilus assembly protein PilW
MMIALVVGAIVLGGVLLTSINSSSTQNRQNSSAFLSEEAQIATSILIWQLRMAGFSNVVLPPQPQVLGAPRYVYRNYDGPPLRGCDGGLTNPNVAMANIACNGGNGPDALTVAYEASTRSTLPTATNVGSPTDCLGQAITVQTPSAANTGANYSLAENTFYVAGGSLMCAGNGNINRTGQPLVNNVVDMQILYGVAGVPPVAPNSTTSAEPFFEPAQFLTATQVSQLVPYPPGILPVANGQWNRVVSLRICLTLRTADEVYSAPTAYTGCDGQQVIPVDRRAYRVVSVNSALKNRTPACADPGAAPGQANASSDRCAF